MQIDEAQLLSFLATHFQAEITGIEPVGQGEWSQAFFFSANQHKKVIRFSAFDEDFKKDRFAARYSAPNLPIPEIEALGEAFAGFFAISARIEGQMIELLAAEELRAVAPALLGLLIALQSVDGAGTHGYGGFDAQSNAPAPGWRDYLSGMPADSSTSRLRGWKASLARHSAAHELYQQGRQRLLELIPLCPEARHLIHNDLLHYNLLIQDRRVAGVIDWGCGMWGDFLYDLAMITTWQFYYPAMTGIDFAGEARRVFASQGVALPNFSERLQCYQLHLLLDSLSYNAWKDDPANLALTSRRLEEVLHL